MAENTILIELYGLLRLSLKTEKMSIDIDQPISINDLLLKLQTHFTEPFLYRLIDDQNEIVPGTIILINKKNIFHINKLLSEVKAGDVVAMFPPGAGG